MLHWRVYGIVIATLRSSYGFHLTLHCRKAAILETRYQNRKFVPVLCRDNALGAELEAKVRVYDWLHLAGYVERRPRPQPCIIQRDWDLVVAEANIPTFANSCRRLRRSLQNEPA